MEEAIAHQLVEINSTFYRTFADTFSASRAEPQPGYVRLLEYIPGGPLEVLDIGCGNGRFGRFLATYRPISNYTGIDFSEQLLGKVEGVPCRLQVRDISLPGCLDGLGTFDLIVMLSAMQHVPGGANREHLLGEIADHLASDGRIILGNWQFLDSLRQRRKIRPWSDIGIETSQVEPGDYLLSWNRGRFGLRYVAMLDEESTTMMAERTGLRVVTQYRADGREGDLNLYTILSG